MGFLDKAKQLAEQAQQKLDETQKQFNQGQSQGEQPQGGGVRYDKHGRPISEEPGEAPPPEPAAEPGATGAPPPQPADAGGSPDATPDPFKPIGE